MLIERCRKTEGTIDHDYRWRRKRVSGVLTTPSRTLVHGGSASSLYPDREHRSVHLFANSRERWHCFSGCSVTWPASPDRTGCAGGRCPPPLREPPSSDVPNQAGRLGRLEQRQYGEIADTTGKAPRDRAVSVARCPPEVIPFARLPPGRRQHRSFDGGGRRKTQGRQHSPLTLRRSYGLHVTARGISKLIAMGALAPPPSAGKLGEPG